MELLRPPIGGMTIEPFRHLLRLLELPPDQLWASFSLLAGLVIACELVRIVLGTALPLSRLAHVIVCLFTFAFQALVLAFVLVYAALHHPGRGWINLGIALALYVLWYLTGELTRLVRKDSEGADLGFMALGALITFLAGLIAAVVC